MANLCSGDVPIETCLHCPFPDCVAYADTSVISPEERKKHKQAQEKEYRQRIQAERRSKGLCAYCGKNPAPPGHACKDCLAKRKESYKRRYARRRAQGLCQECGKPVTKGAICADCRAKMRTYRIQKREDKHGRT